MQRAQEHLRLISPKPGRIFVYCGHQALSHPARAGYANIAYNAAARAGALSESSAPLLVPETPGVRDLRLAINEALHHASGPVSSDVEVVAIVVSSETAAAAR